MTLKRRNLRWEEVDKSNIPLDKLIKRYESFNRTEGKSTTALKIPHPPPTQEYTITTNI